MDTFEKVSDFIDQLQNEGHDLDELVSAMELKIMAIKEQQAPEKDDD